ncbi:hypothetical protein H6P81_001973 [Aristolochia fimbriata]|uniref:Uncharacterized protein n=1 Tax=Aristolochia fimbriata TaxID=158543 RepID=A0AAV7FB78_ARIFI|nr:hypothetical protein H6P81_001973 [Aristolochia fimbriata]
MAAPSVTLVGGLRAFDHTVVVEGETIQTLALYMEGDASHMTYSPSGNRFWGRLATKGPCILPCLALTLREGRQSCQAGTLARQRASWLLSGPFTPPTRLWISRSPFLFESGPLCLWVAMQPSPQRGDLLWHLGIPLSRHTAVMYRESSFSRRLESQGEHVSHVPWGDAVPVDDPGLLGMPVLGKIALFRESSRHERCVSLPPCHTGREDEVHLAALPIGLVVAVRVRAIGDEIRPMVLRWLVIWPPGSAFALAVLPWPAFTKVWDTLLLDGHRWLGGLTCILAFAVYFHTHGEDLEHCSSLWRLDLPAVRGERDPSRDPGTTPAYYTWWATHMSSLFQQNRPESRPIVSAVEDSDEDYDSDRSHPRKRRPNGKRPVGASSTGKKRAPLTILADASGSASKKKKARKEVPPASFPPSPSTFLPPIPETKPPTSCPSENPPIETVQILSSPEAPAAPQEEASVVGEPAEITLALTQSEGLPVQEVAPSPSVVREEAVVEAEAPPPAVEEEAPTPAVEVPAEAAVEVIQEEVPTTEGALETILAPEEAVIEVAPATEEVPLRAGHAAYCRLLSTPSQTRRRSFCLMLRA